MGVFLVNIVTYPNPGTEVLKCVVTNDGAFLVTLTDSVSEVVCVVWTTISAAFDRFTLCHLV